jgi:hypothetical protein
MKPTRSSEARDPAALLGDVLETFGLNAPFPNSALDQVAGDLSTIAGQVPPWSRFYLRQVLTGSLPASVRLARAIEGLAQVADGRPVHLAGLVPIELLADPEAIHPGTVLVGLRSAPCRCPGCPIVIATDGRKAYCSVRCRSRAAYLRRKAKQ